MSEKKKTMIFGGVALFFGLLAIVTAPSRVTPDAFLDQGEPFFPEFTDPNIATSLEVVDFDEETSQAVPFKVVFEEGRYAIPSHYDYPADGKEQLAKTAAGVINLKKDDYRSDNVTDHEACGVLDPLDETATSLTGRGQRVTIKGANDVTLADIIIGNEIEDREGFRFVRVPEQKRVYAAKVDLKVTTKFSDWIEADLLKVEKSKIDNIVLKDYTVNERSGVVNKRDEVVLSKNGSDWNINKLAFNKEIDKTKTDELLKALDELSIVGVRPKPAGLSKSLKREGDGIEISQQDLFSLQGKGYYFSRDGSLLSNEGEIEAHTSDGITYTLRFGEVAYGSGLEVSAGGPTDSGPNTEVAENRYLFISARFNEKEFVEPQAPANTDFLVKADSVWSAEDKANKEVYDAHEAWKRKVENSRKIAIELNDRFAPWYYVISDENFKKLRKKRSDLLKDKKDS